MGRPTKVAYEWERTAEGRPTRFLITEDGATVRTLEVDPGWTREELASQVGHLCLEHDEGLARSVLGAPKS
jgi:hypothetical protein